MDLRYGNSDAREYHDHRELLARPDIDAVLVATGDRWHSLVSAAAARAGKDIYCEKPISMSVAESRTLVEVVQRHSRVFQAGTQRRSVGNFVFAVRLARTGKLGKLKTLHCSISGIDLRDAWLPPEPEPPKEVIDWDTWLGPAPWRPYNQTYTRSMSLWKDFADLGSGGISDWGSHSIDLAQFANDTDHSGPTEFERVGDTIEATYPGGPKIILRMKMGKGTCPIRFEGEDGWVYTDDTGEVEVYPEALRTERSIPREVWAKPQGHVRNFLDCVKSRQLPAANVEVAHRAASVCHVANITVKLGRKLHWDPATETFKGDEQANRLLSRAYREPWRI
jgi:predicted dehydrogenase